MAELRTEEEQIEAIKNWWKENGRSTVLGVILAVVAVFSWRTWQDYQQTQAENAAVLYANLTATAEVQPGQSLTEERLKTATHLAGQLKSEFSDSVYALYADLWLAKFAADRGELAEAESSLRSVIAANPEPALAQVARIRLARVVAASGNTAEAIELLGSAPAVGFESAFYEARGDILLQKGDLDAARKAYAEGVAKAGDTPRPILDMKLADLAQAE